ncbi:MAG: rhodanese-like domain-containing protein [Bacilli bacterium]|nr:rhodanese-like domain-containing protein [Bacilli bacterium]
MYSIDIKKLLKLNNPIIIDIRNISKYNNNHIPGSIHIDEYNLTNNPSQYLDKDNTYYIYCDFGNRSKRLVYYLNSLGFRCVNINGGYNNYLLER